MTKIYPYNNIDHNILKVLVNEQFSFTPKVDIKGMSLDEEIDFYISYDKYDICTDKMSLEVHYEETRNPISDIDHDVIEHYNNLLATYNIEYIPPYNTNDNGYVSFSNIEQFKLKNS